MLFIFGYFKVSEQSSSLIEPYQFTDHQEEYDLNPNLYILEDRQDEYKISQFQESSDGNHFEKFEATISFDPKSTYWLELQLVTGREMSSRIISNNKIFEFYNKDI